MGSEANFSKDAWAEAMITLCACFGDDVITQKQSACWYDMTLRYKKKFNNDDLSASVMRICQASRFKPTLADIIKGCNEAYNDRTGMAAY